MNLSETTSNIRDVHCGLCNSATSLFYVGAGKTYHACSACFSVMLHPDFFLSVEEEKARYETHNNDIHDPGYQNFVKPVVGEVIAKFPANSRGLDFGAGTGPVISSLLEKKGYTMDLYDPIFWNHPEKLQQTYDFIVCCEVIEHFHDPAKEFKLLRSLLKPGGSLFCMTDFLVEKKDFQAWYYKNDPTHVFFYHHEALKWIKSHFGFSDLVIKGRVFELSVDPMK